MQRIDYVHDIQPLSAFRKRASTLIDRVQKTRRPLVLTRNGKSAAIVLDPAEFERLIERLELLEDVQIARQQVRKGETVAHERVPEFLQAKRGRSADED